MRPDRKTPGWKPVLRGMATWTRGQAVRAPSVFTSRFFCGFFFHRAEVAFFAAGDEAFGDGFQLFPAGANLAGFGVGDLVVGGGGGDDLQEVGEFLDDLVGGRDEEGGVGRVLRVEDEETAGALADPLDEPVVAGALI